MSNQSRKATSVETISGDALLVGVAVAVVIGLLWPYVVVWAGSHNERPATTLRPIAWAADKALPAPVTALSPLYQVEGDGDTFTLRIGSGQRLGEGKTAVLVWLEGEWVAMPLQATEEGYSAYFEGWLPDLVTVAAQPTAIRRQ
jgi:hypothetical protein